MKRKTYFKKYYDNGNILYEGLAIGGVPNGYGKEYYSNGTLKYEGEWKDGIYHGEGKFIDEDGYISYDGLWENGKKLSQIKKDELSTNPTDSDKKYNDYLGELNSLIGLDNTKKELYSLLNFIKLQELRKQQNLPTQNLSLHMVFTGNPGTGKTTVARILAKIFKELGILSKGHLVETDRSGLIAGYVGQTALKTKETVNSAMGGILFIDEAYSLYELDNGDDSYGLEAISMLIKLLEDNRDDLIVIVAGYEDKMEHFLNVNPGMKSRFNRFIKFNDYSSDELYEIFEYMCSKHSLSLDEEAQVYLKDLIEKIKKQKSKNFSNARLMRNIYEKVITYQANRIMESKNPSAESLSILTKDDFLKLEENNDILNFT